MATTTAAAASGIFGIRIQNPRSGTGRVQARLGFSFGKKKPAPPPKKSKQVQNDGDRLVWFPGANPPEWLDGSMIGDRGFDPFGLGKPAEYLQYDFDGLDQNLAKNVAGDVIGIRQESKEINPTPFQPYTEVFGIERFRECELIHGRWAMLGTLGAIAVEALTGIAWQDAGKNQEMGRLFVVNLEGKIYSCKHCKTHLALYQDIISKSFHCKHGKAYLFNKVANVTIGETEDRMMMTGKHTVADLFCVSCGSIVGWRYVSKNIGYCKRTYGYNFLLVVYFVFNQETAHEKSQKYKEGKSVLERFKISGPDGSNYWMSSHGRHLGGSDADDA